MICTTLLLAYLIVASYTDVRWRVVYNGTTYSGILVALLGSALESLAGMAGWWENAGANPGTGFVTLGASFAGLLACGAVMLVSYVLLPGGVGGGDLKLLAMVGAFLGMTAGLEAMLWTLVLGGCLAVLVVVWREGVWNLVGRGARIVAATWRRGSLPPLDVATKKSLGVELFLSPSALLAVLIVRFHWVEWF